MSAKVEGHEGDTRGDPFRDHGHDLDLAALGAFDPDLIAVADADIVGIASVDLDEHVLLKLGQPWVGPRLVTAALIFDQTA